MIGFDLAVEVGHVQWDIDLDGVTGRVVDLIGINLVECGELFVADTGCVSAGVSGVSTGAEGQHRGGDHGGYSQCFLQGGSLEMLDAVIDARQSVLGVENGVEDDLGRSEVVVEIAENIVGCDDDVFDR